MDRNKTLAKILRERDAEIARRALPGIPASSTSHEVATGSPAGPSSPHGSTKSIMRIHLLIFRAIDETADYPVFCCQDCFSLGLSTGHSH